MMNGLMLGLGWVLVLILGICVVWLTSVRLIGRGVPFVNPEILVRYPENPSVTEPTSNPKSAAQRILPLQGAANFRDLGGYHTNDGRQVRWGLIYRSEALGRLSQDDLLYLTNLGLRLICDLRTPAEINRSPDRVPSTAQWVATPAQEGDFDMSMLPTLLFNRKIIPDLMHQSYLKQLADNAQLYGAILSRFAHPDNLPAVFHCTAGKDRAGLTAALLLGLLGVPEKTIIEDYTLSNLAFYRLFDKFVDDNRTRLRRFGIPMKELYPMLIADPIWMEDALSYMIGTYGSIEAYLLQAAGLEKIVLVKIRENLLE
jgi:protein-tyrosine phosphatase